MEPSDFLRESFEARQATRAYQDMLVRLASNIDEADHQKQRSSLPIAAFREQIVSSLESSQILVLSGETGWYVFVQRAANFEVESQRSSHRSSWKINSAKATLARFMSPSHVVSVPSPWLNESLASWETARTPLELHRLSLAIPFAWSHLFRKTL